MIKKNIIINVSAWLGIVLGFLIFFPHAIKRLAQKDPAIKQAEWQASLKGKIKDVSEIDWLDSRGVNIFAGDSHIELGSWYDLFCGRYAVRNCGLSGATIEDVSQILSALSGRPADRLILMCGINDILRNKPVDDAINSYRILLTEITSKKSYKEIFVMSVLPINDAWPSENTNEINSKVVEFNARLQELCSEMKIQFSPLSCNFTSQKGALIENITNDGLHLNAKGYKLFANSIKRQVFKDLSY